GRTTSWTTWPRPARNSPACGLAGSTTTTSPRRPASSRRAPAPSTRVAVHRDRALHPGPRGRRPVAPGDVRRLHRRDRAAGAGAAAARRARRDPDVHRDQGLLKEAAALGGTLARYTGGRYLI